MKQLALGIAYSVAVIIGLSGPLFLNMWQFGPLGGLAISSVMGLAAVYFILKFRLMLSDWGSVALVTALLLFMLPALVLLILIHWSAALAGVAGFVALIIWLCFLMDRIQHSSDTQPPTS